MNILAFNFSRCKWDNYNSPSFARSKELIEEYRYNNKVAHILLQNSHTGHIDGLITKNNQYNFDFDEFRPYHQVDRIDSLKDLKILEEIFCGAWRENLYQIYYNAHGNHDSLLDFDGSGDYESEQFLTDCYDAVSGNLDKSFELELKQDCILRLKNFVTPYFVNNYFANLATPLEHFGTYVYRGIDDNDILLDVESNLGNWKSFSLSQDDARVHGDSEQSTRAIYGVWLPPGTPVYQSKYLDDNEVVVNMTNIKKLLV